MPNEGFKDEAKENSPILEKHKKRNFGNTWKNCLEISKKLVRNSEQLLNFLRTFSKHFA